MSRPPMLAGATGRDRVRACLGAAVALALVGVVGALLHGDSEELPWIVAPVAASAMLVFVVPTSPMAQPWPTIGGNALSALVGYAVGEALGHGALAVGLAVGLAIGVMTVTRALHAPGAAVAATAALGGPIVAAEGWLFCLLPVALNSVVLVAVALVFHRWSHHDYPHHPHAAAPDQDLEAVLAELGETFDISVDDLQLLVGELEKRVLASPRGG